MKKLIHSWSARRIALTISAAVSFLIFLGLFGVITLLGSRQLSQRMADRWSDEKDVSQVSCFFSANASLSEDAIEMFRHSLDNALLEASIVQDSPNAGARLWADAYSADGRITLQSDRASLEADAVGVGGDFFQFHPLKLLEGSYFSGSDLNQDYCVIDEDAAWQLFGSNDVAGMTVYIGGVPHMVIGVVERESGRLNEAAGLDTTLVYVSYRTLKEHGSINAGSDSSGINHYEIVMPNPVSKYAFNYVKEHIGVAEKDVEIVENTTRYQALENIKRLAGFGTRSMNGKAIIYPYWENVARGYEDIISLITLFAGIFLLYAAVILAVGVILWWRHKTWTVKGLYLQGVDRTQRAVERRRQKRKAAGKGRKRKKNQKEFWEE